jgi:geranylgeranylglycerol-phosphate geranylgeranyltransferase
MNRKQKSQGVRKGRDYAKILSLVFWKAFWTTMRPYLTFVSGVAGLVGLAFIPEISYARAISAFIPLFLSYGLGQALTDCFQIDTDAISSPYRPLVRGVISRRQVLVVSLTGLLLGILILGYLNPAILVFGILAVAGLLTYTIFKRTWWGGPPWNSWIVALLPIMGRLVDRGHHYNEVFNSGDSRSLAFLFAVLAVFFGYANFVVIGYFKDISADRATGYRTFPVVFGWRPNAMYSDLLALAAAAFTGASILSVGHLHIFGVVIFVFALGLNAYAQILIHRTRDERKAHGPIAHVVRCFVLYSSSIVVTLKIHWIVFVVVFYLLFEFTLKMRPEERQV